MDDRKNVKYYMARASGGITQCDWSICVLVVSAGKLPCCMIKSKLELGIFIEVFRIVKDAQTLLWLFCKAVYVKAQQMDI